MIQHVLKHPGETVQRHGLIGIGEIAIVPIGANGNAGSHLRIQLRGIETPLFAGVTAEHLLVEIPAHAREHDIFGGADGLNLLSTRAEELL